MEAKGYRIFFENKNVLKLWCWWDFPAGAMVKNLPANAEDTGLITAPRTKTINAENNTLLFQKLG